MDGYPYEVIRSRRKSISLEISRQGRILVRAPLSMSDTEVARFVSGKEKWLRTHLEKVRRIREQAAGQRLTGDEIRALADRAGREIPPRVGPAGRFRPGSKSLPAWPVSATDGSRSVTRRAGGGAAAAAGI